MPKSCGGCDLCAIIDIDDDLRTMGCRRLKKVVYDLEKRISDCPLEEVEPHGRLIDADALLKKCEFVCTDDDEDIRAVRYSIIENAPTIIPAEEGE